MTSSRAVLLVTLAVGTVILAAPRLEHPVRAGSASSDAPYVTRVFYVQGMELREAVTLLRSRVHVRQMAEVITRNAIVVCEVADRVERSESLLRENDALVRATDPHEPVSFERAKDSPLETRVFPVESGDDAKMVVTILRAIYQMRDMTELADESGVSVRAALPLLDASEELLRELGLLVE